MARSSEGRRAKLTKRTVDAAKPAGARFIVWDAAMPGFGLRVEPSGAKVFIARYRAGGGRAGTLRQATVGRYGTITADEARQKARKLLAKAAGGGDPVGDKRAARQAGVTVGRGLRLVHWRSRSRAHTRQARQADQAPDNLHRQNPDRASR